MRDYMILTDSCCDLTAQLADELGIIVLPLTLLMDGQEFRNYLDGREISPKDFYARIRSGSMPTTSAVNVGAFEEVMRPLLEAGKDILYLAFSSALSTTHQSACIAAEGLRAEFPDAKIHVVDTLGASMGQGLLVYLCAQQKKAGKTVDEVRDYAENTKLNICHWFTVDDLNHLKRGGRVSAATALLGTMLAIKPVLHVDDGGHLTSVSKARGRKASLMALADEMGKAVTDAETIFISHGDCEEDVNLLADELRSRFGVKEVVVNYVGPVIGAHTGAGVVALFFVGSHR